MPTFVGSTPGGLRRHSDLFRSLFSGVAALLALALPAGTTAYAQAQQVTGPAQPADAEQVQQLQQLQQVEITGTLIQRPGYEAPTPVTSVGQAQIQASAFANIADFVNELPELSGSITSMSQGGTDISSGTEGVSYLNLRNLGTSSTLVLMDGNRLTPSDTTGAVNINYVPTGLVQRVDIVTGGASAMYGSDAVAGVVNFILNKNFTGIRVQAQGGITTYGDDPQAKFEVTIGEPFASGKGHFLFDTEYNDVRGFSSNGYNGYPRDWATDVVKRVANPNYTATNGQPFYLVENQVGMTDAMPGGIIVSGPLQGTYFGPGGTSNQFVYGPISNSAFTVGGDYQNGNTMAQNGELDLPTKTLNVFTRGTYDLSDTLTAFGQFMYGSTAALNESGPQYQLGNVKVSASNPFLPASVAAQAAADGLTTLTLGTFNADLPITQDHDTRELYMYSGGLDGQFDLFKKTWTWKAFAQYGSSPQYLDASALILGNETNALNSVRLPSGKIVCASTVTNPGNGCVPYNPFGTGVNGSAAVNYLMGLPWAHSTTGQTVANASIQGEPFSLPAGPVSLAFGAAWRKETVRGFANPLSVAAATSGAPYFNLGNYLPTRGHYEVSEGFAETVLPLLRDLPGAKTLDVDLAARATYYSTSGYVTTYKGGLTYAPISSVKFRVSRSHDIRAPDLANLYAGGTAVNASGSETLNPFTGQFVPQYFQNSTGNPNLVPETANTTTIGLVLQPSWLPAFAASVDYYTIAISGVIATVAAQTVIDRCYEGQSFFCNQVTYNPSGQITEINQIPFNFESEEESGLDIDLSYQTELSRIIPAAKGTIALRGLINHVYSLDEYTGVQLSHLAGVNSGAGPVSWRWYATLSYMLDPVTASLTWRGITGGTYSNAYLQCTTGCPASTLTVETINDNWIPGQTWLDSSIAYRFGQGENKQVYLSIQNLMNTDPPPVGATAPYGGNGNGNLYDLLGRVFRLGFKYQLN
jgi:outer membrane receptor protein involved in Fe transport